MSRILVFTPVWKRPEITEAYCLGLSRLKESFDIEAFCVLSEEDPTYNRKLLEKYQIEYTFHENKLGAKKNHGLREALKKDFDYLMELNSDDIIKNELVETYLELMDQKVPFIGVGNFAFYQANTGKAKHKKTCSTLFGIGRCYEKNTLAQVSKCVNVDIKETVTTTDNHYKAGMRMALHPSDPVLQSDKVEIKSEVYHKLWDDEADKGMDNHSSEIFAMRGIVPYVVSTTEPQAFDIKSDVNIWPYHKMSGEPYSVSKLFHGLSQQEKDYLYALREDHRPGG